MAETMSFPVKILGQEFKIKANRDEGELLEEVASLVTRRLEQLSRNSSISTERIAIMTAFQFAYELKTKELAAPVKGKSGKALNDKVDRMIKRIERAVKEP